MKFALGVITICITMWYVLCDMWCALPVKYYVLASVVVGSDVWVMGGCRDLFSSRNALTTDRS